MAEPITRNEIFLNAVATGEDTPEPITRKERFLAKAAGKDIETGDPITREEMFISQISGGGEEIVVEPLDVTENGTYTATTGTAYSPVTVNVQGGAEDDVLNSILDGTISGSYYNNMSGNIRKYAFSHCPQLTGVNFPNVLNVREYAFADCFRLKEASFSGAETIQGGVFYSCSGLTNVNAPNCRLVGATAFSGCSSLTNISFPQCSSVGYSAFTRCNLLVSVFLLGESVPYLANSGAFAYTPILSSSYTGSFGSIFVLPSMASTFRSATNWAYFANRITAYEGE